MNFLPESYLHKIRVRKFISLIIAGAAVIFFALALVSGGLYIVSRDLERRLADYNALMTDGQFVLSDAVAAEIKQLQSYINRSRMLVGDTADMDLSVITDIIDCLPSGVSVGTLVSNKESGTVTVSAVSDAYAVTEFISNLSTAASYDINIVSITKDTQGRYEYVLSIVWGEL